MHILSTYPISQQYRAVLTFVRSSWMQAPYGNLNAQPMSKGTKGTIKLLRWVQLGVRVLELLGAAGSLALFIMISGIDDTESWIMRIPVKLSRSDDFIRHDTDIVQTGIAMLHAAYGIYHLSRKAGGRTPGSSASYMAFAAAADITFVPFYAFSAYMSAKQYKLFESGATGSAADGEWTTLLPQGTTIMSALTGAAFLTTTITGGLLLVSMGI